MSEEINKLIGKINTLRCKIYTTEETINIDFEEIATLIHPFVEKNKVYNFSKIFDFSTQLLVIITLKQIISENVRNNSDEFMGMVISVNKLLKNI